MSSNFIKAAEVWLPSADGTLLEFGAGSFGAARRFAAASQALCFGRGEGLPGRAWEEAKPIILHSVNDPYFRRASAASAAGLTCAVALPLFPREQLSCVVVLFCSHSGSESAALEHWHCATSVTTDMTLVDGVYGPSDQEFESDSRQTCLPRGAGLPGLAWQRGEAVFLEELTGSTRRFVRAESAADTDLQRGLAIPISSRQEDPHVIAILGSSKLPLAQGIERWAPNDGASELHRVFAFSELFNRSSKVPAALPIKAATASSSILRAWSTGTATINEHPREEHGAPAASAAILGAAALVAIPVVWDGEIVEIVALYL